MESGKTDGETGMISEQPGIRNIVFRILIIGLVFYIPWAMFLANWDFIPIVPTFMLFFLHDLWMRGKPVGLRSYLNLLTVMAYGFLPDLPIAEILKAAVAVIAVAGPPDMLRSVPTGIRTIWCLIWNYGLMLMLPFAIGIIVLWAQSHSGP